MVVALRFRQDAYGRALVFDVPSLALQKGDRLEPSTELPDTHRLEHAVLPIRTTWWRFSRRSRVLHYSPILQIEGAGVRMYRVDLLHSWHLGPCGVYVSGVLRFVLAVNDFAPSPKYILAEDARSVALLRLKGELWDYYRSKRATDPDWRKRGSEARH